MTSRTTTTTKYFGWAWQEMDTPEGAAFQETWMHDDRGGLISRKRVPLEKDETGSISTDPRAATIMAELVGRN